VQVPRVVFPRVIEPRQDVGRQKTTPPFSHLPRAWIIMMFSHMARASNAEYPAFINNILDINLHGSTHSTEVHMGHNYICAFVCLCAVSACSTLVLNDSVLHRVLCRDCFVMLLPLLMQYYCCSAVLPMHTTTPTTTSTTATTYYYAVYHDQVHRGHLFTAVFDT
jgi:hypothetical protein